MTLKVNIPFPVCVSVPLIFVQTSVTGVVPLPKLKDMTVLFEGIVMVKLPRAAFAPLVELSALSKVPVNADIIDAVVILASV